MSALTLTALAENIYRARDTVARELVGFIPAVMTNSDSVEVSTGGTVDSVVTSEPTLNTSITPSMTIPNGDAQTLAVKQLTLNKAASVRIPMTGENTKKLQNIGTYPQAVDDMFSQALRVIVNQVEIDVATELNLAASRATGTAGTNPFATNFNPVADLRQILVDNGSPQTDLRLVVDSLSGTKLRQTAGLWQANTAGSDEMLRSGRLLDLYGLGIGESAGVQTQTKGTGAGYLVDLIAGYVVGDTLIHVDTGTNTILAGDVVTFTGDTNQYVVTTGFAGDGDGDITIAAPGLQATLANNVALTITATHTANIGLQRSAAELALRPPANPEGGDAATDMMIIADDKSPLVFTISEYKGYHTAMWEIACVYGVKAWKPDFIAKLLG